jgi:fatty-acyl-CoA synthase
MKGIATMADVLAAEAHGLPEDLPASTYDMIQRAARQHPDAPALSFFLTTKEHRRPETWSYARLMARITQAANLFHSLGADKDTVIAFILPNLPETHFTLWGGQAAGVVFGVNPLLETAAIAELLNAARASILVTLAPFPGTAVWPKVFEVLPRVPSLRHVVLVNSRRGVERADPSGVTVHDFRRALSQQPSDRLLSGRRFSAADVSSYFCTGGTTGAPKIAMRRHGNEVANAWSVARFLGDGIGPGKSVFCGLPLFHVNGVLVTGLLPFSRGAHVVLGTPQGYRGEGVVERFWEIVEHHRINLFSGVPTLYASLLQVPVGAHRLDSLEYGLCGAAPMPVALLQSFQERTGLRILEGYGLTEATCVSSVNPPLGERRVGSIGLRIPGQEMKPVVLDERGHYVRDCAVGEVGVIAVSGPNVFAGYKLDAQNQGLWLDRGDGKRWLNTGDLARQDAEGYFWLVGRKKELIIRGGHNIDPLSIEDPLHRHPAVEVAAAVGRPDAYAGELPVAYVQLKAGASASEQELISFLSERLSERAALPKHVHVIDRMPLTAVGKIFKPALKHREARDALGAALREGGVAFRELGVSDDPARGTVITLRLDVGASAEAARQILGRFPFPFTVAKT